MENGNYFLELYKVNVNDKVKKKQNLSYLPWAFAWAEVKKLYPDATYKIYHRVVHTTVTATTHIPEVQADPAMGVMYSPAKEIVETREVDNEVNYFTDGSTCWVKVSVTIEGIEHIEELPIMDLRNKPQFGGVDCMQVNKAIQRGLTKAAARHGLGLYIYAGEDLPEVIESDTFMTVPEKNFQTLKNEIIEKISRMFGTKHETAVDEFIRKTFNGVRISDTIVEDYDKLIAAKQFLDSLK